MTQFILIALVLCVSPIGARQLHGETSFSQQGRRLSTLPPLHVLPSETILKNLLEQRDCVKTPAQYIAAFLARDSRCVDSDLIGRVTSAETAVKAGNLDVSFKPAFFWAGNDGLAKWMRIGVPLTLGDFVVDHLQDFGSADFAGVQEKSNGQSLLEAVGYPGNYANISRAYAIHVVSRRALKALLYSPEHNAERTEYKTNVLPLRPTWSNVRDYFNYIFSDIGMNIPAEVVPVLEDNTEQELTGCPAQCAYTIASFPGPGPASVPISVQPRAPDGACPSTQELQNKLGDSFYLDAPTAVERSSPLCKGNSSGGKTRTWVPKFDAMAAASADPTNGFCTAAASLTAAQLLKAKLEESAGDSIEQAMWFRAYLIQTCNGEFNPLFAGDGYTYTGLGGLLSATASEYIMSPFNATQLGPKARASTTFCINGLNGGQPNDQGLCPAPTARDTVV